MNKYAGLLEIGIFTSIFGILTEFFASIQVSYIVLLVLIGIDTTTGMAKALKYKRFSSKGLSRIAKKFITYSLAIISVRLLEYGILNLYETTLITQILLAYLVITETISILENLTALGVPIPSNFIPIIIKNLRIPFLKDSFAEEQNKLNYRVELDYIINHILPTIEDNDTRNILDTFLGVWKDILPQIATLINNEKYSNDLIYTKMLSLIELSYKEITQLIKEEELNSKKVKLFINFLQERNIELQTKIEKISYSSDSSKNKTEQIILTIMTYIYTVVLEVKKMV